MKFSDKLILFLAQGFGVGRIPFAPGTWGSLLGIGWFLLLIWPGNFRLYLLGTLGLVLLSVWICGRAAKILGEDDPWSVVMDEIAAVPLSFLVPMAVLHAHFQMAFFGFFGGATSTNSFFWGRMAGDYVDMFVSPAKLWLLVLGFALFRLFDIWKPWPVRQSQRLPGGWGVVVDDVLAAVYVNLVMVAIWLASRLF